MSSDGIHRFPDFKAWALSLSNVTKIQKDFIQDLEYDEDFPHMTPGMGIIGYNYLVYHCKACDEAVQIYNELFKMYREANHKSAREWMKEQ